MIKSLKNQQPTLTYRIFSTFISFTFMFSLVIPPQMVQAQSASASVGTVLNLPIPGAMVSVTDGFTPAIVRGVTIHPDNPLLFDFIIDRADSGMDDAALKEESTKLVKYFLATLTVPEEELWVNLSPYEEDRIVAEGLGDTEMGRDLLAQDYLLKQLTASLMYPEDELGQKFWKRVYSKAYEQFGTTKIPMNTFNKVWIVPENAVVFEHESSAYVVESHLKVMLEEDYLALQNNLGSKKFGLDSVTKDNAEIISGISLSVVREILIPEIEKEVNEGETFANLRQVYNSMILATWYKQKLLAGTGRDLSLLGQIYIDKNKTKGVDTQDKQINQKIYDQYVEAFKTGVYNYIRADYDEPTQARIPRKYFSGGVDAIKVASAITTKDKAKNLSDSELLKLIKFLSFKEMSEGIKNAALRILPSALVGRLSSDNMSVTVALDTKEIVTIEMVSSAVEGSGVSLEIKEEMEYFRKKLNLSALDVSYTTALYRKYLEGREELRIRDTFVPSADLEFKDRKERMGIVDVKDILADSRNKEKAKDIILRVIQLKGGLGSSFKRPETLKRITGRTELADKASDSYFENVKVSGFDSKGDPKFFNETLNVSELKVRHMVQLAEDEIFKKIIIEDLVNGDSIGPVKDFYKNTQYVLDRIDERISKENKRTYADVIEALQGISLGNQVFQGALPVVDAVTKKFIDHSDGVAPGGHGFLGTYILNDIANKELVVEGEHVIATIANGDGVNNFLAKEIAVWMKRERIPIVMVSTTRTLLDSKGGIFGLEKIEEGVVGEVVQLYEKAQAERAGQFEDANGNPGIFQKIGLTEGEPGGQLFNTNVSAENETLLQPFLKKLKQIIGLEEYFRITTPDLITNAKKKKIGDEVKNVFQLEGAKGSALLNLDKYVRTTTNPEVRKLMEEFKFDRLVYIVNYGVDIRSETFTPEKFVWDHILYDRSDLFEVDIKSGQLKKRVEEGVDPAHLPGLDFGDYYKYMENSIRAWGKEVSLKNLKNLKIRGKVHFPDAVLKGIVSIESKSDQIIDLNDHKDIFDVTREERLILEDVSIIIEENGEINIEKVTSSSALVRGQKVGVDVVGGINLNPNMLHLKVRRNGAGVPLPIGQQPVEFMQIDGFVPVIIQMMPIQSALPMLLGILEGEEDMPSSSASGTNSDVDGKLSFLDKYRQRFAILESI